MPSKFKRTLSEEDLITAPTEETESLLDQGSEDDDFFLNGPTAKPKAVHFEDDKIKQVRVQIAEVTDTMRSNVGKILDRGDRLDDLRDASERLGSASLDFQTAATRMRKRAWMQHIKTRAILAMIVFGLVLVVIVPLIVHYS